MKNSKKEKQIQEHGVIAKLIFLGKTNNQIANELNYSVSAVAFKVKKLFKKYNARTRFEFILGVMGEINEKNKEIIAKKDEIICRMDMQISELKNKLLSR